MDMSGASTFGCSPLALPDAALTFALLFCRHLSQPLQRLSLTLTHADCCCRRRRRHSLSDVLLERLCVCVPHLMMMVMQREEDADAALLCVWHTRMCVCLRPAFLSHTHRHWHMSRDRACGVKDLYVTEELTLLFSLSSISNSVADGV